MNEKQRVEQTLQAFFDQRTALQKELQELRLDTRYTPEHRQQLVFSKESSLGALAEKAFAQIKAIILSVQAKMKRSIAQAEREAHSSEFQAKLSGVLHSLELGAASLSEAQISAAVAPYRDNPLAMAALHGALIKGGVDAGKAKAILGSMTDSESVIQALDTLLDGIRASLVMHPVYGMSLELASIKMLLAKWNEDLLPA